MPFSQFFTENEKKKVQLANFAMKYALEFLLKHRNKYSFQ